MRDLARHVLSLAGRHATGDLAALRRLDPDRPNAGAFFRLLAVAVPERLSGAGMLPCWGLIVWAMAQKPEMLRQDRSLGRAQARADVSEARVDRLLAARGDAFRAQVRRTVRLLASAGEGLPYLPVGLLVLAERRSVEEAERLRLEIARDYWRSRPRADGEEDGTTEGDDA